MDRTERFYKIKELLRQRLPSNLLGCEVLPPASLRHCSTLMHEVPPESRAG